MALIILLLGVPLILSHAQITGQPNGLEVCEGSSAAFSITISGSDSAFQWQTYSESTWTDLSDEGIYSGTTSAEMQISLVNKSLHLTMFRCLVDLNGNEEWDETSEEVELRVISIPVINGPILGKQSVCFGSSEASYMVAEAQEATGYEWTIPEGAGIIFGHNSPHIIIDFKTAGSGTVSVIPTNRCFSGEPVSIPITVIPLISTKPQIIGETELCKNYANQKYSIAAMVEATGYHWEVPEKVEIIAGEDSHSITVNWNDAEDGTISVEPYNSCGPGPSASLSVIVGKEVADPGPIRGRGTVCHSELGTKYEIDAVLNASKYEWEVPPGAAFVSEQNGEIIKVDWKAANSGNISVIASNRCYPGSSSEKSITVLEPIIPAKIDGADEICYNTMPLPVMVTIPHTGADENLTYQWQESRDNSIFTDIENETNTKYQPGNLFQSTYFRLSTISTFGCSPTYSDEVFIHVFDPFVGGALPSGSNVCYIVEPGQISFATQPSGGSEDYNYNWQRSGEGGLWEDVGSDSEVLHPEVASSDTYFRVIVSDNEGCGVGISNEYFLHVYAPFLPGTITPNDTLCAGDMASMIRSESLPSGGDGSYSYKWELSPDSKSWKEIEGANNETLEPGELYRTSYYRRTDISGSECGSTSTRSIIRFVHPLPEEVDISGEPKVCLNESDLLYSFEGNRTSISHSWWISGGEVLSHPEATTIRVNWDTREDASLVLIRKNDSTGCIRETDFGIQKKNLSAPDKSEIIRKYGSDMLILMDTTPGVKHIWWYNNIYGEDSILIQENEKRYCALPHSFDTAQYKYWISTAFIEDQEWECKTNSYMGQSLISRIPQMMSLPEIRIYPNPTEDLLYIGPIAGNDKPVLCRISDINGRSVFESLIQDPSKIYNLDLSEQNPGPGIYMVSLYTKYGTVTQTLVIH